MGSTPLARHVLGFTMLFCTLLLWLCSSLAVQWMSTGILHYESPLFTTLFNSSASALLLLPALVRSSTVSIAASIRRTLWLSCTIGSLWTISQLVYNVSLLHTSVATNTVLSSTSSVFTFGFSLLICKDEFRWISFASAMLSFFGCFLVARSGAASSSDAAIGNSGLGELLAVLSAALFALAAVLLRRFAPEDLDLGAYMGATGLIAILLAPALLAFASATELERFAPPPPRVLLTLGLNAAIGSAFANYLYNSAMLLLSPLVANIVLSLSIPISAITDEFLLGQHRFSSAWAAGASIATMAVVLAAFDMGADDEVDSLDGCELKSAKLEEASEDAELQSLIGKADDDDLPEPADDRPIKAPNG